MMVELHQIPATKKEARSVWEMLGFAWEVGYIIAIPAFLLGFGGAYLDKYYLHMAPLGVIGGLAIAFIVSGYAVYTRVRSFLKP